MNNRFELHQLRSATENVRDPWTSDAKLDLSRTSFNRGSSQEIIELNSMSYMIKNVGSGSCSLRHLPLVSNSDPHSCWVPCDIPVGWKIEVSAEMGRVPEPCRSITDILSARPCHTTVLSVGTGRWIASEHAQAKTVSILQDISRDHPFGSDAVRSISALAPQCGRPVSRTGDRREP